MNFITYIEQNKIEIEESIEVYLLFRLIIMTIFVMDSEHWYLFHHAPIYILYHVRSITSILL